MIILDATNAVLGRLASFSAKKALEGEDVIIVNSEKAIITGKKLEILAKFRQKRARGGDALKGPNFPRAPDRILKRVIRGMLPEHRRGIGRQALQRVKTYIGVPKEFENQKMIKMGKPKKEPYVELSEISRKL